MRRAARPTGGGGRAADGPAEGRRHDPSRPDGAGGRARPGDGQQPGRAHRARPDRRVPRLVGRQPRAAATARRELVVERRRLRVDVQAAPRRDVPRRPDDGRRGRGDDVRPPRRPGERFQRAVGVRGRALEGWIQSRRRHHGRVHARRAERQLPLHRQLGQLQLDHPAQGLRGRLGPHLHRHRAVEARRVPARRGHHAAPQRAVLG